MPDPPSQSDKREQPNLEQISSKLQNLEDTIDQTISKKLAESYKCMEENIIKVNESYAEHMKSSIPSTQGSPCPNFREIISETQNEELVQLKEREARVCNIITHGLREQANTEIRNEDDRNTIQEFLNIIKVNAAVESITRLGKYDETKSRPIKVVVKTVNDKNTIMGKLSELKTAPDKFKRIRVTDDYTAEERLMIRNKLSEARNKTETEGNGAYELRGTPKNGLFLKRFKKTRNTPINNYLVSKTGLNFLYTNADQFINKRDELSMFIASDPPDIMLITEIIPKKQTNPIAKCLLDIDGYNFQLNFYPNECNLGASGIRGVAIYYKEGVIYLQFIRASLSSIAYTRPTRINETLILGDCISYLSPSGVQPLLIPKKTWTRNTV